MKNAKFLGYCFYMNTNISRDFQICISVSLKIEINFEINFVWFSVLKCCTFARMDRKFIYPDELLTNSLPH